jgi:hypothetical protein
MTNKSHLGPRFADAWKAWQAGSLPHRMMDGLLAATTSWKTARTIPCGRFVGLHVNIWLGNHIINLTGLNRINYYSTPIALL